MYQDTSKNRQGTGLRHGILWPTCALNYVVKGAVERFLQQEGNGEDTNHISEAIGTSAQCRHPHLVVTLVAQSSVRGRRARLQWAVFVRRCGRMARLESGGGYDVTAPRERFEYTISPSWRYNGHIKADCYRLVSSLRSSYVQKTRVVVVLQ